MLKIKFIPTSKESESFAPKPIPAQSIFPQWFKDQKPYGTEKAELMNLSQGGSYNLTVKKCQAIADTLSSGYLILCPMDIYVDATGDYLKWRVPPAPLKEQVVSVHGPQQIVEFPIDKNIYSETLFRIMPCWAIETPKGYSSLFVPPMNRENILTAVPGIIDTDGFASNGGLSFLVKKGFSGIIPQGTPIVQVIPFKREEWKSEVSPDSSILRKQSLIIRSVFQHGYKKNMWKKKVYR
jgi:hypothetical protein